MKNKIIKNIENCFNSKKDRYKDIKKNLFDLLDLIKCKYNKSYLTDIIFYHSNIFDFITIYNNSFNYCYDNKILKVNDKKTFELFLNCLLKRIDIYITYE